MAFFCVAAVCLWLFLVFFTLEFFELDGGWLAPGMALFAWPLFWLMWAASKAAQALRRKAG